MAGSEFPIIWSLFQLLTPLLQRKTKRAGNEINVLKLQPMIGPPLPLPTVSESIWDEMVLFGYSSITAVLLCLLHSGAENRCSECVYVCVHLSVCSYMCRRGAWASQNGSRVELNIKNFFFNLTLRHAQYPVIQCTLTWFQFEGWCLQVIFSQRGAQIKTDKCNGPASICVSFKTVISFMLIRKHTNGSEMPS